jgi:hypothetical protein
MFTFPLSRALLPRESVPQDCIAVLTFAVPPLTI